MKFRRKSTEAPAGEPVEDVTSQEPAQSGPYDSSSVPDDLDRVDLGSLRIAPVPGRELRLQVNEESGDVAAVLLVGEDGAMEMQPFSAPRTGSLWDEARPQIVQDVARRGGQTAERQGRFGTELLCQVPAQMPDGSAGVQPSRVIGIDGPRWMLRVTLLGRPAVEPEDSAEWEDGLAQVVVHRGDQAMPPGRPLPFVMPPQARRSD